jgi:hypothetical protein
MRNQEMMIKFLREQKKVPVVTWFYGVDYRFPGKLAFLIDIERQENMIFSKRMKVENYVKRLSQNYFNINAEVIKVYWKEP